MTSVTSADRLDCARKPSTRQRSDPRPRGSFSLPHLCGGEGIFRQPWIAEAELDLDHTIAADARAYGECQAAEDELKMRDLKSLRCHGDLAVGGDVLPPPGGRPRASRASAVGTMRMGA